MHEGHCTHVLSEFIYIFWYITLVFNRLISSQAASNLPLSNGCNYAAPIQFVAESKSHTIYIVA